MAHTHRTSSRFPGCFLRWRENQSNESSCGDTAAAVQLTDHVARDSHCRDRKASRYSTNFSICCTGVEHHTAQDLDYEGSSNCCQLRPAVHQSKSRAALNG